MSSKSKVPILRLLSDGTAMHPKDQFRRVSKTVLTWSSTLTLSPHPALRLDTSVINTQNNYMHKVTFIRGVIGRLPWLQYYPSLIFANGRSDACELAHGLPFPCPQARSRYSLETEKALLNTRLVRRGLEPPLRHLLAGWPWRNCLLTETSASVKWAEW